MTKQQFVAELEAMGVSQQDIERAIDWVWVRSVRNVMEVLDYFAKQQAAIEEGACPNQGGFY